jgi:hypothetical protein
VAGELAQASGCQATHRGWTGRVPAGEDGTVESLAGLRERRGFECRLTPDRVLRSLEDADEFLRDRGLLTRTADCALPSLYEACHEDPYKPGSPGFATWPATKWPWFGELAGRGYLVAAVHRGKNLLVTGEVAGLLDPICRAEIERMRAADRGWGRLLDHLAAAGPSSIEDLRTELGLKRKVAAGAAGAVRRDRLALAAVNRRGGTPAFERAGTLGPGLSGHRRNRRRPQPGDQEPARRWRARSGRRARA